MSLLALLFTAALMAPDPYAPPQLRSASSPCVCPATPADVINFNGHVIDAEMTLAPDKRSTNERMATIFDVKSASDPEISGRTRVWHNTSEEKCGVQFDYGKAYTVYAHRTEKGELETNRCLIK